jgi:hypothetical protein
LKKALKRANNIEKLVQNGENYGNFDFNKQDFYAMSLFKEDPSKNNIQIKE